MHYTAIQYTVQVNCKYASVDASVPATVILQTAFVKTLTMEEIRPQAPPPGVRYKAATLRAANHPRLPPYYLPVPFRRSRRSLTEDACPRGFAHGLLFPLRLFRAKR